MNEENAQNTEQTQNAGVGGNPAPAPEIQQPKPTGASYFRQRTEKDRQGEPVQIGEVTFLVGRPSLASLTDKKIIPSELAAAATNVQQKMSKGLPISPKEYEGYSRFEQLMVMNSVRSPKIVERDADYDSGQISISDLSDTETTELMMFIQGGLEALRSFRVQRQRAIARLGSDTVSRDEA
jgi:hypothetical protein